MRMRLADADAGQRLDEVAAGHDTGLQTPSVLCICHVTVEEKVWYGLRSAHADVVLRDSACRQTPVLWILTQRAVLLQ